MVPKTVGSPRSAQHAPRPGPRTRELHGGGRAGVSPGGKGQLRARSSPSSQLQATPALHSALEPGLCHLPPARLCPWEGRRRGQVWAPSCQPPVSLPPSPAPHPREQFGPFTALASSLQLFQHPQNRLLRPPSPQPHGPADSQLPGLPKGSLFPVGAAAGSSRLRDTRCSHLGFSVLQEPG